MIEKVIKQLIDLFCKDTNNYAILLSFYYLLKSFEVTHFFQALITSPMYMV